MTRAACDSRTCAARSRFVYRDDQSDPPPLPRPRGTSREAVIQRHDAKAAEFPAAAGPAAKVKSPRPHIFPIKPFSPLTSPPKFKPRREADRSLPAALGSQGEYATRVGDAIILAARAFRARVS